jgi:hypothetical protein
MNSDDGKQLPKRGRPKKIKTIEEIELEKQRKKEIKQKWYEENKNNIIEKNKNYYYDHKEQLNDNNKQKYYEKQDELKNKSKYLQTKYRDSYRLLCKLLEDNTINSFHPNFEEIKNIVQK